MLGKTLKLLGILAPTLGIATASLAEPPRIVTDIAPVHSLVAMVTGDLADPALLLPPGGSPHHTALTPSQADAVETAGLIVWIGAGLSPDLGRSLDALAPEAPRLTLLEAPESRLHPFRALEDFGAEAEDHDGDAHDHADTDPHAWLAPDNARAWLGLIAERLAALDPDNAITYRANAAEAAARIDETEARVAHRLAPLSGQPLLVDHDALQYFEAAFGLTVIGAVTDTHAAPPSPRSLAALRDRVAAAQPVCVLAGPGADRDLIASVTEALAIPVASIDTLGGGLTPGAALYPALLEELAEAIATCAG